MPRTDCNRKQYVRFLYILKLLHSLSDHSRPPTSQTPRHHTSDYTSDFPIILYHHSAHKPNQTCNRPCYHLEAVQHTNWLAISRMFIHDSLQLPYTASSRTRPQPNMQTSVLSRTPCATHNADPNTTRVHPQFTAAPRNHASTHTNQTKHARVRAITYSLATHKVVSPITDVQTRFTSAPRTHATTLTKQTKCARSMPSHTACAPHTGVRHTTDVHSPFTQAPQNNAKPHTNPNKHALFCAAPTTH